MKREKLGRFYAAKGANIVRENEKPMKKKQNQHEIEFNTIFSRSFA